MRQKIKEILMSKRAASPTREPSPKRASPPPYGKLPCKFFSQGSCRFGDSCLYSHSMKAIVAQKLAQPCRFFMNKGSCADGDNCRFLHIKQSELEPEPKHQVEDRPVCRFFTSLRGCKSGDSCPFLHPKDEEEAYMNTLQSTGQGAKILNKYSMVKTAEEHGVDAFIRKQLNTD